MLPPSSMAAPPSEMIPPQPATTAAIAALWASPRIEGGPQPPAPGKTAEGRRGPPGGAQQRGGGQRHPGHADGQEDDLDQVGQEGLGHAALRMSLAIGLRVRVEERLSEAVDTVGSNLLLGPHGGQPLDELL